MARRKRTVLQRDPLGNLESVFEEEEEQDDSIVADGGRVRVRLDMMDAVQRDVAKHAPTGIDPARHRPGFRDSRDTAALDALEQAYRDADLADANAWQSHDEGDHPLITKKRTVPAKQEGDSCQINGRRGRLQMVNGDLQCILDRQDSHTDDRASAYAEYDREAENAWRT